MKYTLFDPYFGLSLKVSIRKEMVSDFRELLRSDCKYCSSIARDNILLDVSNFLRHGIEPTFITRYTAKRIITFFGTPHILNLKSFDHANR